MTTTRIKKYTVLHDELDFKGRSGIYCFLPYETLDADSKAVFKIGLTTQDFADRIEQYHTYYPMGVYMVFFLTYPKLEATTKKALRAHYSKIEAAVFNAVVAQHGQRIKFASRPGRGGSGKSEWVYASYSQIHKAFLAIIDVYGGELEAFHLSDINKIYTKNMCRKHKYEAKIVYKF